jgi:hypothetical protein
MELLWGCTACVSALTTHFFHRRSRETVCLFMAAVLSMLAMIEAAAAAAESKQIMLLHSFGKEFKPWSEYAQTIREELKRQSPWWTVSRTHLRS